MKCKNCWGYTNFMPCDRCKSTGIDPGDEE